MYKWYCKFYYCNVGNLDLVISSGAVTYRSFHEDEKHISFPCSSFHLVDLISLATAIVKWGAETSSFTCSEYIPLYRYTISHIQLHFMVKELCGCWIASPSLYSSIGRVCSLYSSIGRVCPVCERSVV